MPKIIGVVSMRLDMVGRIGRCNDSVLQAHNAKRVLA
jgi:hypothetical protein